MLTNYERKDRPHSIMETKHTIDDVPATVTLGLESWAFILSELPENDEITKALRKQVKAGIDWTENPVLAELFK